MAGSLFEDVYGSKSLLARLLTPGLRAAGGVRRFVLHPQHRWETLTRLLHSSSHLQGATYTELDRYPELFEVCRKHLQDHPSPSILSFGCSTGEEVFTLARYLPQARITGVDLNRWCLKQARAASSERAPYTFLVSGSAAFAQLGDFDAIFCMAVLQRTENREEGREVADAGFTFARFEQELAMLDRKLKSGGLLFVDQTDFSLLDTELAIRYRALEFAGNRVERERPLYGPDNRLRSGRYMIERCFIKLSALKPFY
jgi:hypothetical protein